MHANADHPTADEPARPGEADAWAADVLRCRCCQTDLARLPAAARFCPRCGSATVAPPVAVLPLLSSADDDDGDLRACVDEWLALRAAALAPGTAAPRAAYPAGRTDVVIGYAAALYRLGWRYERGLGARRNVEEAIRCYLKSARLGNAGAMDRLAPRCAHPPADPSA